jgi:hypothetical protein
MNHQASHLLNLLVNRLETRLDYLRCGRHRFQQEGRVCCRPLLRLSFRPVSPVGFLLCCLVHSQAVNRPEFPAVGQLMNHREVRQVVPLANRLIHHLPYHLVIRHQYPAWVLLRYLLVNPLETRLDCLRCGRHRFQQEGRVCCRPLLRLSFRPVSPVGFLLCCLVHSQAVNRLDFPVVGQLMNHREVRQVVPLANRLIHHLPYHLVIRRQYPA